MPKNNNISYKLRNNLLFLSDGRSAFRVVVSPGGTRKFEIVGIESFYSEG